MAATRPPALRTHASITAFTCNDTLASNRETLPSCEGGKLTLKRGNFEFTIYLDVALRPNSLQRQSPLGKSDQHG